MGERERKKKIDKESVLLVFVQCHHFLRINFFAMLQCLVSAIFVFCIKSADSDLTHIRVYLSSDGHSKMLFINYVRRDMSELKRKLHAKMALRRIRLRSTHQNSLILRKFSIRNYSACWWRPKEIKILRLADGMFAVAVVWTDDKA